MPNRTFPFRPKSNTYLEPGDYFGIPLPQGKWSCGRVLGRGPSGRSTFVGTVMDWCGPQPPTCDDIENVGFATKLRHNHVKTITNFGMQIDGNCPIDQSDLPVMLVHSQAMMRGGIPTHEPIDVSAPRMPAANNGLLLSVATRTFSEGLTEEEITAHIQALRAPND